MLKSVDGQSWWYHGHLCRRLPQASEILLNPKGHISSSYQTTLSFAIVSTGELLDNLQTSTCTGACLPSSRVIHIAIGETG